VQCGNDVRGVRATVQSCGSVDDVLVQCGNDVWVRATVQSCGSVDDVQCGNDVWVRATVQSCGAASSTCSVAMLSGYMLQYSHAAALMMLVCFCKTDRWTDG